MSGDKMGGPAFPGATWSEARRRFRGMRYKAKDDGKYMPSFGELESVVPRDMRCPSCSTEMNWFARDGHKSVMTLQHDRDGSIRMLCLSCNTRHAFCEGDSFYDIPNGHKPCAGCDEIKPLDEFWTDNHRRWESKQTYCKSCAAERGQEWRKANREKYNRYMREYRDKRKQKGRPVASGS